jgi:CheY-like chemotaxis protein
MNGSDAIKIIHSLVSENKIKKIPIIVATAFQDEININNILSSNPDKILNKPLNKAVLLDALKPFL